MKASVISVNFVKSCAFQGIAGVAVCHDMFILAGVSVDYECAQATDEEINEWWDGERKALIERRELESMIVGKSKKSKGRISL